MKPPVVLWMLIPHFLLMEWLIFRCMRWAGWKEGWAVIALLLLYGVLTFAVIFEYQDILMYGACGAALGGIP